MRESTFKTETLVKRSLKKPAHIMMDGLPVGIWISNTQGVTEYINPYMAGILGLPVHRIVGRSVFDFVSKAQIEIQQERLKNRMAGGSETYSLQLQVPDGNVVPVVVASSPFYDAAGEIIGSISTVTNCTGLPEFEKRISADVINCGNLQLSPSKMELIIDGKMETITGMALRLLEIFVRNPNVVLSRERLVKEVWDNSEASARALDAHMVVLRKRLKTFNGSIKTVYGQGYILAV